MMARMRFSASLLAEDGLAELVEVHAHARLAAAVEQRA
jgi:hypothetical protein